MKPVAAALSPPGVLGTTWLLTARELGAKLVSPWFFGVVFAVCMIAFAYGAGFQRTFRTESLLVSTNPLLTLDITIAGFLGVVLGLRLAAALAWEREHRTLEVLLVGPVSWGAIVLSKFLAEAGVMVLVVALYLAYLVAGAPLGPGVASNWATVVSLPLFVMPLLGLGLLVSAVSRGVRGAVVLFVVLTAALALLEGGGLVLQAMPVDRMSLLGLYLRAGLEAAEPVLALASPVGQLAGLAETLTVEAAPRPVGLGAALALTVILIALSVALARARGAVE